MYKLIISKNDYYFTGNENTRTAIIFSLVERLHIYNAATPCIKPWQDSECTHDVSRLISSVPNPADNLSPKVFARLHH
jgi:hypothetical protein